MWPGFDSRTRRHKWAEFVGSLLCSERFFSGYSGFPLSSKTNIWFDLIWFDLICVELSWVELSWFELLWFKKGIPSIGITSGISCSWYRCLHWSERIKYYIIITGCSMKKIWSTWCKKRSWKVTGHLSLSSGARFPKCPSYWNIAEQLANDCAQASTNVQNANYIGGHTDKKTANWR